MNLDDRLRNRACSKLVELAVLLMFELFTSEKFPFAINDRFNEFEFELFELEYDELTDSESFILYFFLKFLFCLVWLIKRS